MILKGSLLFQLKKLTRIPLKKMFCTINYSLSPTKIVKKQRYKIAGNLSNIIISN
jgi:hypothetical protein